MFIQFEQIKYSRKSRMSEYKIYPFYENNHDITRFVWLDPKHCFAKTHLEPPAGLRCLNVFCKAPQWRLSFKSKPVWMFEIIFLRGIAIFGSGLDFQLIFKL